MYKRILLAYDGSVEGRTALREGAQDHTRRVASLECLLPERGTEAPTVTWVQAWKAERGNWIRKIVAARLGKFEKR